MLRIAMIKNAAPSTLFNVQFGKINAAALYDTGAMLSVISLSFYEVLGSPQLRRFQRRLVGAGGDSLRVHGVCSLKMKLGASVLEQTFVVCDDLAYDVIMGMDMIFSNHITMEMLHSGVGLRINGELVKSQWQKEREDVREQAVKVVAVMLSMFSMQ